MRMPSLPHPCPERVPGQPGFGVAMLVPVHVPRGTPATVLPPVQVYIKWGDWYQPVDGARLDLGDHRVTLTPPGGAPLVITTPMLAKATCDKTRVGLVLVPSAFGA